MESSNYSTISSSFEDYEISRIILMLAILAGSVADIYLIVIINKFKAIQTEANLLFCSVAWCHLFYTFLGGILSFLISILTYGIRDFGYYIVQDIDYMCLGMMHLTMTFIVVDWAVSQYFPSFHDNHPNLFKRGVLISFLLFLPVILPTSYPWFTEDMIEFSGIRFLCKAGTFSVCFVVSLALFIIRNCKPPANEDPEAKYRLMLPCVYFLMVLPSVIDAWNALFFDQHVLELVFNGHASTSTYLTSAIFVLAQVVMVSMLSRTSKYFRANYFCCCKRKGEEGSDEDNLNDETPFHREQCSPVTFEKKSEAVNLKDTP